MKLVCIKCNGKKFWKLSNGEYRCKVCRKDIKPRLVVGMKLTKRQWIKLIDLYFLGANGPALKEKLGMSLVTINKALRILRTCMALDVPDIFSGTVEVDETYLGGQWKNKRKSVKKNQIVSKRGLGTTKQPAFGILARNGQVWAELVEGVEARDLMPLITKQVKSGVKVCSDTWRAYTGLAAKGYVHRTVDHGEKEYVRGKNHINGLEGFWGFLKRKLASKGGVRRLYLPLFLGEYVWRYNHRDMSLMEKRNELLALIFDQFGARY